MKNDPNMENKDLLHGKFYGAWHEKSVGSKSCDIWGLGTEN